MSNQTDQTGLDDIKSNSVGNGSPATPRSARDSMNNFLVGGAAGSAGLLIGLIILSFADRITDEGIQQSFIEIAENWISDLEFIFSAGLPAAICLGLPIGGIAGLILGRTWRNKKAALIGGLVAGMIITPLVVILFIFSIFGGFN